MHEGEGDPAVTVFVAALERHSHRTVEFVMHVPTLVVIMSSLQLALRHPDLPDTTREILTNCLRYWIDALGKLDPALKVGMLRGMDPGQDVPVVSIDKPE